MPLTILSDEDETEASPDRPRFRVFVVLPGAVERLIEWPSGSGSGRTGKRAA